jgi:hypothetical protein
MSCQYLNPEYQKSLIENPTSHFYLSRSRESSQLKAVICIEYEPGGRKKEEEYQGKMIGKRT